MHYVCLSKTPLAGPSFVALLPLAHCRRVDRLHGAVICALESPRGLRSLLRAAGSPRRGPNLKSYMPNSQTPRESTIMPTGAKECLHELRPSLFYYTVLSLIFSASPLRSYQVADTQLGSWPQRPLRLPETSLPSVLSARALCGVGAPTLKNIAVPPGRRQSPNCIDLENCLPTYLTPPWRAL